MVTPAQVSYESGCARAVAARHAIAFGFARHALSSFLMAAGMTRGDEVALSPLTCKVVPLALLAAGLCPVYVDISASTLNLDPERLNSRTDSRLRAVMFQHTYGRDAGVQEAAFVAQRRGWMFVEDCAQCLPFRDTAYAPGTVGLAAVFSNNLLKPLPAGSGGLLTTNDDGLARRTREARDRLPVRAWPAGLTQRVEDWLSRRLIRPSTYWSLLTMYRRVSPTYRERPVLTEIEHEITRLAVQPSTFQLRAGARWLGQLASIAAHRRLCCANYDAALAGRTELEIPPGAGSQPLLYFPVLTPRKQPTLDAARSRRLPIIPWPGSTPIYPLERLEALRQYGYVPGSCPVAESIASRLIGLPTEPDITTEHRQRIAALVADMAVRMSAPEHTVNIRNEFADADWTAFVRTHPDATLYHTLQWRDFIADVFGHTPRYLVARAGGPDNRRAAALPRPGPAPRVEAHLAAVRHRVRRRACRERRRRAGAGHRGHGTGARARRGLPRASPWLGAASARVARPANAGAGADLRHEARERSRWSRSASRPIIARPFAKRAPAASSSGRRRRSKTSCRSTTCTCASSAISARRRMPGATSRSCGGASSRTAA